MSWPASAVQNRKVAVFAHGLTRLMIVRCGSARANASSAEAAPPGPSLRAYAEAMTALAAAEVASLGPGAREDGGSRVALAESAVVGMVLRERILLALHRLAQEDASCRHFG